MGFNAAAKSVEAKSKGKISAAGARAIIAEGARNASAKAKKANPRLKRVKG